MRFRAIEHILPSNAVTNDQMIEKCIKASQPYLSEDDLHALAGQLRGYLKATQSKIRYLRAQGESALDLGIRAGQMALEKSGLSRNDIDLLIYVGVGRGFLEPATANVFQATLGLKNATCFDVLDACASWMRALHISHSFLRNRLYQNIMILNCECNLEYGGDLSFRKMEDVHHNFAMLTIGEAATATIVTDDDDDDDMYYATFENWGDQYYLCRIPLPHYREFGNGDGAADFIPLRFYAHGERLFRVVFKKLVDHFRGNENINTFKPDVTFGHSASNSMSQRVAQVLRLEDSIYLTHPLFGNTVSASIPIGMSHAIRTGRLEKGMKVLLGCGSAGVATAWSRFRYLA
jgi:3-oxoacyl-[acyl-carrier-protein] synthase III